MSGIEAQFCYTQHTQYAASTTSHVPRSWGLEIVSTMDGRFAVAVAFRTAAESTADVPLPRLLIAPRGAAGFCKRQWPITSNVIVTFLFCANAMPSAPQRHGTTARHSASHSMITNRCWCFTTNDNVQFFLFTCDVNYINALRSTSCTAYTT